MTAAAAPFTSPLASGHWIVDPHRTEVDFAARAMWGMSTVRGRFDACRGSLTVYDGAASGELAIDARSLDTGNRRRDRHLRSADFFDVERHPWIRFTLTALTVGDLGSTVAGRLRLGVTDVPSELAVEIEQVLDGAIRLQGTTVVSRVALGLAWNRLGVIGDATSLHARITLLAADALGG